MINHLSLALIALLPLAVLLVLRRFDGQTLRPRFITAMAFVLALQLWTATEVFASLTLFGVLAFVLAGLFCEPAARPRIRATALETLAALVGALLLSAPYLYYAIAYPNSVSALKQANAGSDLANFLIPTQATWLHVGAPQIRGNLSERLAYLGLPLIALLAHSRLSSAVSGSAVSCSRSSG